MKNEPIERLVYISLMENDFGLEQNSIDTFGKFKMSCNDKKILERL